MKVLIIPEDPTLDQYILKPVVERVLQELGRRARVEVLWDPRLRGIHDALDADTVAGIVDDNPMVDLFLLMIDRDCNRFGNQAKALARQSEHPQRLLVCLAIEEVEVWMLALFRDGLTFSWSEVRKECDPKERFALPFLQQRDWSGLIGGGRKRAMRGLGKQWAGLTKVCPEIGALSEAVDRWLRTRQQD